ncbi:hypothetical protein ACIBKX_36365 [Streptomyces sp. NPDC050658]|uniref:hypothetical protein n=1 Tax=unclassified Streptomyces TaxID=2593676 RepID=UPI00341BDB70
MGIKDQFQDKAGELSDKAKQAMGGQQEQSERGAQQEQPERGAQQEQSERAGQAPDEAQRAAQEAQDKFNQDYDA